MPRFEIFCFIVSTVNALQTPMINASMVLCDRHFGGINYPVGGVGGIATSLADGLVEKGSEILYKANVTNVILENGKAVSCLYRLEELYLCWVLYLS